ncbi:MAG: serpin family protein, partial [Chloroflexota bacterium]
MEPARAVATAYNQLGFRLLRELAGQDVARNVALSPVSVATALTILLDGAAGTTARELRATLGLNELDLDQV